MTAETPEKKPEEVVKTPVETTKATEPVKTEENGDNTTKKAEDEEETAVKGGEDETHDPYYPPIVSLPLVDVFTGEDGEVEIFKRRAKLYRYYSHLCSWFE